MTFAKTKHILLYIGKVGKEKMNEKKDQLFNIRVTHNERERWRKIASDLGMDTIACLVRYAIRMIEKKEKKKKNS